ncbi:MAG: hypothetical protein AAGM67_04875 [Bacteroidota bacterium]
MDEPPRLSPASIKLHGSGYEDQARDMLQLGEEYWLLGDTRSATQGTRSLPYLIITDLEGNELLTEVLDLFPSENADIQARAMYFISEELGLVITGDVVPEEGKSDFFVAHLNLNAEVLEAQRYGEAVYEERASAIVVDEEGFAYVLGTTTRIDSIKPSGPSGVSDSSDIFLSKINLFAPTEPLFYKSYGYTGIDVASDLLLLPDGNLFACGTTDFPEGGSEDEDLILLRINLQGNPILLEIAGEPGQDEAVGGAEFIRTSDGELRIGLTGSVRQGGDLPLPMITMLDPFDLFVYGIFDSEDLGLFDIGGDLLRGSYNDLSPQGDGVLAATGRRIERDAEFSDLTLTEFIIVGDGLESGFGTTHGSFVGDDEGRAIVSDGDRVAVLGSLNYAQSPTMIFIGYDLPY